MQNKRIAIFCGSKEGVDTIFLQTCKELASVLSDLEIDMVYGGGRVGLMGTLADEMLARGRKVYGVIPHKLIEMEVGHMGITELYIVDTMHDRKAKMAEMSDGFLALPGGIGTLEEIIEVFTWQQIGYHNKPCGLLNTSNYFEHLIGLLDQMVAEKFLSSETKERLLVEELPHKVVARILDEM